MRTRLLLPLCLVLLVSRGSTQPAPAPAAATTGTAAPTAPSSELVPSPPPATAPVVEPVPAPAPAAAPSTPEVAIKDTPAPHAAPTKSRGQDTLSVDFPDDEIRNILRNVADLFELNLIIPETLQGRTSIKLRDVTWRQIFQSILDPVGFTYVEDGNIIKIVTKESLNDEPVSTEVFVINYASAGAIAPTIQSLVDPAKGKIVVDTRSNSLVITERPSRMNRIRPIIEQLDKATDQVMIESKFVEVTDRDVKNLGVNWSSLAGYNVGVSPSGAYTRTQTQDRSNGNSGSSTTGSNNSNTTTTGGTNSQTSGSTTSSSITADADGNLTSTSTTGSTGGLTSSSSTTTTGVVQSTANDTLNLLQSLANGATTERTLSAVFSADQFKLVLSALQSLDNTKVVSNPTIVTLNNAEATINVGEEYPVPKYSYSEQKGTFEVSGFDFKPIGVILKVTPQVNARGFIKLTASPEVSQQNGSVAFGGASGTQIPIIATRKAVTQVSLKDGYTMGIGGLLTQSANKTQTKVPVLGSIPVLGRLFRSDGKNTTTTNLIIFITAKSISAEGAPTEQIFNSERVRQLDLRREDLPGYRDGSDPFIKDPPPDAKAGKKAAKKQPAK